jgi:hypothetical protein
MACDKLSTCIFFNDQMEAMPGVGDILKKRFCEDQSAECARFKVAARLGGASVPGDLYPGDLKRAEALLSCG